MRAVYFGSGGLFSRAVLEGLAGRQDFLAVVVPGAGGRGLRRAAGSVLLRAAGRDFRRLVRGLGLPVIPYRPDGVPEAAAALGRLDADLFCIASFPWILPEPLLRLPRLGTVNLHPSLLPRHRGSDPVFWTFAGDDAETGVTLHWVVERVDAGDVIAQRRVGVERGVPGAVLTARLAREGAELLLGALPALEARTASCLPQDEALATREPAPSRARWPIDWATWPAERVWHFLRGVGTGRLSDAAGRPVTAGEPRTFGTGGHGEPPGSARKTPSGVRIFCQDGWVDLMPLSRGRRLLRGLLRRAVGSRGL